MTEAEVRALLLRPEGESLDYKVQSYEFPKKRLDFMKDVLAMANTPRSEPARIVLGVKWTPENGSELVGLVSQFDDVEFQDAFQVGKAQPRPRFKYIPYQLDGKFLGVIEIPVSRDGPFSFVIDGEGIQAGALYWRKGSQNDRAVGGEIRTIVEWFGTGQVNGNGALAENGWRSVLEAMHRFQPTTQYILVTDRIASAEPISAAPLASIPWRAVIDFDPSSDVDGFLSSVAGAIGHNRVVHKLVRGDVRQDHTVVGVQWYFARGLVGRQDTLVDGDYKVWVRNYKQEIGKQTQRLASAISPTPVAALVIVSDMALKRHFRTVIEELVGAFGESIEVLVVARNEEQAAALRGDGDDLAQVVALDLRSLCSGIAVHFADLISSDEQRCVMPSASGAPVEIPRDMAVWIKENLELVDRSAGNNGDDQATEYRRGADITWRNLNLRHDCDRDISAALRRQVEDDLRRRQTVRINLYHAPGAGGTSVARRIGWDLHDAFPVALLEQCSPKDTADRIAKLASITNSSVLLIVDGGYLENEIDMLYELLKANHTPTVLLQVVRRTKPSNVSKRLFWLDAILSDMEAERFRTNYCLESPHKKGELQNLSNQRNDASRNAFFFGLTAFEYEFLGLVPHVSARIKDLTALQKRILAYIAISHFYGHESVPGQTFAQLLGMPRSKPLNLGAAFSGSAEHSLELLFLNEHGEWRASHHLVAFEMIKQILAPQPEPGNGEGWRQRISDWATEFATLCRGDEPTVSERLLQLVRRVFIYRNNSDVLGTESAATSHFAQIIEDIPSSHGKIQLLKHLVNCYPDEAHLYAHLGRFLGLNGDSDEGIAYVDKAISLQKDDHVLHHMRGMVIRQKMRAAKEAGATIFDLATMASQAADSFAETRRLNPEKEHGYIGEVQMLIQLLDWSTQLQKGTIWNVLARTDTPQFLRNAVERAETLLDQVRHIYEEEKPSRFVMDCRARMQVLYGNFTDALQVLDSLLNSPLDKPSAVRRQIVWTILRRHDGNFAGLSSKECDRVLKLLNENLDEDIADSTSLRLWLRAVRQSNSPPSMDSILEKVTYWKANTDSLDAAYYLYVLHSLRAMEGSVQSAADAARALEECRTLARFRRDRTKSFEWIGNGMGISKLVHQSQLGEWEGDFWQRTEVLSKISGRIFSMEARQKGQIELAGGLKAFFVPAKSDIQLGRDENALVSCFVGFSYEGVRAWSVEKIG
jgi:tetratricopeptide (TPR) repeat protein